MSEEERIYRVEVQKGQIDEYYYYTKAKTPEEAEKKIHEKHKNDGDYWDILGAEEIKIE